MEKLAGHLSEVKFSNHRIHKGGHASKARQRAKKAWNRAVRRASKKALRAH